MRRFRDIWHFDKSHGAKRDAEQVKYRPQYNVLT